MFLQSLQYRVFWILYSLTYCLSIHIHWSPLNVVKSLGMERLDILSVFSWTGYGFNADNLLYYMYW